MSIAKKIPFAVVAVGSLMMAGAGVAAADNSAKAGSLHSPGLQSGLSAADVLSEPLNNCATNVSTTSLLSGTAKNACLIK